MEQFPNGSNDRNSHEGSHATSPSGMVNASAFERGQEFLGQCPELLGAEVAGALAQLHGLDTFVEAWARARAGTLDSADIARLARTVIASARARGEVAASLLKTLPPQQKRSCRGPRQEA